MTLEDMFAEVGRRKDEAAARFEFELDEWLNRTDLDLAACPDFDDTDLELLLP